MRSEGTLLFIQLIPSDSSNQLVSNLIKDKFVKNARKSQSENFQKIFLGKKFSFPNADVMGSGIFSYQ